MTMPTRTVRAFLEQAVSEVPDEPYLIWEDRSISYAQFDAEVNRAARIWLDLGIDRGDRVAMMAGNSPEFLYSWLGLAKIGATLVAINTGFKTGEVAYILQHSGARIALVDPEFATTVRDARATAPSLESIYSIGPCPDLQDFEAFRRVADPAPPATQPHEDDVVSFIYTSGTTGKPKAVMHSQRNFVLTGEAYPAWMGMEPGDRIYACLPLFHINSQAYSTMGAIGARGTIVLVPRFSASRFWSDITKHRVAVFNFIGAMTLILSKKPPEPADTQHVVKVAYGVPALPGELRAELEARYGMRIVSGFGMSETTFGLLEPFDERRRAGAMGFPRHHPDPSIARTEAKVVDEAGNEVADGAPGELVLRGPATMLGYFNDPEKTAEALQGDWLHTGDMAYRDTDGQFFFLDRKKDIVRRRGENVSSLEVEDTINHHPAVLECAVVGVPSDVTDEDLLVYVVPRDGYTLTFDELAAWTEERLARFKVPRYYARIDALPKTPTQKVEKHRLRALAGEHGIEYDNEPDGRR